MKIVLIIVVLILVGLLSVSFGYIFLPKNNNNSLNQTNNTTNFTNQTNGTSIPYSPEYITFSKAKSIAKEYAGKGVVTSDPILIKDKNGNAIYICNYLYNGSPIGGIIINAKTGEVLTNVQKIPTTTPSNSNNEDTYENNDENYDETYEEYDPEYDDTNQDNDETYEEYDPEYDDSYQDYEENSNY
jgi:hypothetical protein